MSAMGGSVPVKNPASSATANAAAAPAPTPVPSTPALLVQCSVLLRRSVTLTVDDHPILREGIAAILASETDMVLVGEAGNGREAIEQFRTHRPDITLRDLQMPLVSGGEAIVAIREEFPNARII